MNPRGYRDLIVWQKAMDMAVNAYTLIRSFPTDERFGLISQVKRAAASVSANIAEGHAVGLPKPFIRHLRIANGSLAEVEAELLLAVRLNYVEETRIQQFLELSAEVRRMIFGLKKSLERK